MAGKILPMGKEALIRKEYGQTQKRVLYGLLGLSFLWTGYALFWLYEKLRNVVGIEIAQVALSIDFAFVLFLVAVGFFIGHRIDRMIQKNHLPLHTVASTRWLNFIIQMWKYERNYLDVKEAETEVICEEVSLGKIRSEPIPAVDEIKIKEDSISVEMENIPLTMPKKRRRGRPPTFPVGRWVPVALKWESHDPLWDEYSLGDVISEYLGIHPDGSPILSDQVYYKKWRDLALEEAERMRKSGEITDSNMLKLLKKFYEKKSREG
ncbi:MAG: hypothetical protein HN745_09185 [Deltaproteobacteria bacterium]|jgi:hypothetical protein|nr:hypothetical protein [Deltaproteobacteria bacterium]